MLSSEIIDFDYILTIMNEIIAENKTENMDEIEEETTGIKNVFKRTFYVRLGSRLPSFVLKKLHLRYQTTRARANYDVDFPYNKMVCLYFLEFCIENRRKLHFNLSFFEKEEDKKLILRHIWNNIYIALSSHYPKRSEDYVEYRRKYNAFERNIQKIGETFVLKVENCEYILPINHFDMAVFFHKYGIGALPQCVKENLASKDLIDAGAFIGDSALIFNELKPNKIYAFEPSRINYLLMQKTLKLNKLFNVVPLRSALGNKESISNLFLWGNASFLSDKGNEEVNVTTIDCFQEENSLNIGLIKMDIEGSEFYAIHGAEKTIKKFKPVLIISLYHRGKDFFEIPKILKDWVPTYNLRFLNLNKVAPILERVVLAY
jgi:FkbM family methyltransferase